MMPSLLKKILPAIVILLPLLAGCRSGEGDGNDSGTLQVAAGIGPVAALVEEIGGDSVAVECLLPSGADPESFDPGTRALRQLSRCRLYFATGTLPFEEAIAADFSGNKEPVRTVNLSDGITLIYGTHGDEPDPHTWMSARNLAIMARHTAEALCAARPAAAGYFRGRLAGYERRLHEADSAITAQLAPFAGGAFAVGHPSLSYMARDYSMRQLPLQSGTKESSAKGLRQRTDSLRAASPRVFFAEPGTENDIARETARQLGIPMATIDAMSPDIITQLQTAAYALAHPKE